ncbi:MAG TPA: hypothetical protein VEM93_10890, partial [Actinomycetota bacterium]|nr:hypothetical protein [Actinomycetota bacterium]
MDLDSYVAKYGPEWKRLESAVSKGSRGLSRLPGPEIHDVIRLYLRASAHLSEVQTLYRDLRLESYLNGLVGRAHAAIYSSGPATLAGLLRVFGSRYRQAITRTAPFILVMAALLVAVTIATDLWIANSKAAQDGLFPEVVRQTIRRAGGQRPDLGIAPAGL